MQGHIRRRGKRSWAIIIDAGTDATGKRKQQWHSLKGSKKDAEAKLSELISQHHKGIYIEPSRMTLREYMDKWLADYAKPNTSPKTYERYTQIAARICEDIGTIKLLQLRPLHIQGHYTKCLNSGRKNGKGGLSAQTVLHHHRILKEAIQQAVKWELLAYNPLAAVEPPRPVKKEMQAIDEKAIGKLLRAIEGTKIYHPVLFTLATGLRRGELLALRWKNIDFQNGQLNIQQSLIQTKEGGVQFKMPKTHRSKRSIALPLSTIEHLKLHHVEQAEQRLKLGDVYQNDDLVFPRDDGTVWAPNAFTSIYVHILRQVKAPYIHFHGLRHSHATLLLKQGTHPKIVSERLGHATIALTLDTYSHVLPGMQEEAAQKMDVILKAATRSTSAHPEQE